MLRILKLLIWIVLIGGGFLWWKYQAFQSEEFKLNANEKYITVEKGDTFQSVLADMFGNGLLVKLYLKQNPPEFMLQAGKYEISSGYIADVVEELKTPINETDEFVTFLEGWNIYDIDKTLTERGLITAGEFIDYSTQCEGFCEQKYNFAFIADTETLEGFLYPDTYAINPENFTIKGLVEKMLSRFQEKVVDSGIITDMGSIEILDVINMASIVQKEANKRDNPEEIAIIAGILKKRLEENWQIGADATICYPYKIATQDCTPDKVLEYLYDKNEYNTRQMTGLPRTAISNPEDVVIEATLNSKDSPYYYYLHDNSGQIHYAVDGAGHEANKQKYLY